MSGRIGDCMKLYFLKQKFLDILEQNISDNLNKYQDTETWIDQYFIDKDKPNYFFDTGIEIDDYQLILGGPETDFSNAKILYEALQGHINLVQASDLRLWAYMAHKQHWDYMRTRWGIDITDAEDEAEEYNTTKNSTDKAIARIGSRYFFKASKGKAFVRQGIARLYWSVYLTYDENNENGNPYEYTEYFFSKQDIFTSITERSYARNKVLVLTALKELKKNPELSRVEVRTFLAKLNQAGAITVLDFLDKTQAEKLCENVMNEIKNITVLEEDSHFIAVNEVTGKLFGPEMTIKNGQVIAVGKRILTKPKNLIGKKEGEKFIISGKRYVIKDIK